MKQAIIESGSKQYLVNVGDRLAVDLMKPDEKLSWQPLLLIDGDKVNVGQPFVQDVTVTAKRIEDIKEKKITSIRFKAKKRIHKKRGHRQQKTIIQITAIS